MRLLPASLPIALLAASMALAPIAAKAAPTTSRGAISVAQVLEMAKRAETDPAARQTMIAYLAGVGESTGLLVAEAEKRGAKPVQCQASFNLDESVAVSALTTAAPKRSSWNETAATPIIIADMFARAGCS